jgi:DNA invertase Pin-like site-specific DNA recombinase
MSKRLVAYYRVSTDKQGRSGLGLDAQRTAISEYVAGCDATITAEFVEIESGGRSDRPELAAALRLCKKANATLVIGKLDRLARSVAFIAGLMEAGVEFVACDMPHANKLTIHIMAAMAEYEREVIGQRTRAALAVARARGVKLGCQDGKKLSHLGVRAIQAKADTRAANAQAIIAQLQHSGLNTYKALATALNARGIITPRGCLWHPETVRRTMMRSQAHPVY